MISHTELVEINGPDYNPSDLRTHIDSPLTGGPAEDIYVRLALELLGKGKVASSCLYRTKQGTFFPAMDTPSMDSCANKVILFPKLKDFSGTTVVRIKNILACNLLPANLAKRFNMHHHIQSTPIFFDHKKEIFFVCFDMNFLSDIHINQIQSELSKYDEFNIIRIKGKKVLTYNAKTIAVLKKDIERSGSDSNFSKFLSFYRTLFIDFTQGKKVIIFDYSHDDKNHDLGRITNSKFKHSNTDKIAQLMSNFNLRYSLLKGLLLEDRIYSLDENDQVLVDCAIPYDKRSTIPKHIQQKATSLQDVYLGPVSNAYLVLPYSDADWELLSNLDKRIKNIFSELESVLLNSKTEVGQLDTSLSELSGQSLSSIKLLTSSN
ncbi:hypothetical protein L1267_22925 [Pseudoalteromonas sp. OFAV1]|uniref:hypothetical protein n=1 Tax=Pseudoalteromonas sp. OFAV1 TaxID=2908892 RepID=UPI001F2886EF|nr:hypothetical protein [Pseudoalteromonas sp. OFAV1]MCF2903225.1 hypothetical protein [Pseudoalteromonas sp. OFAV1]